MGDKILTLKVNYILTGMETDEDFKEWVEDLRYFTDRKKEKGYRTRLSITITNLILYDLTSLKYEKRRMALESYRYDESDFINKFLTYLGYVKELGIGINLYGVGGISAFDQSILDLGYMGTSILINSVVKDGLYYDREITRGMSNDFLKRVSSVYSIEHLFSERGKEHWFPSSLIRFKTKVRDTGVLDDYENRQCESCINPSKIEFL